MFCFVFLIICSKYLSLQQNVQQKGLKDIFRFNLCRSKSELKNVTLAICSILLFCFFDNQREQHNVGLGLRNPNVSVWSQPQFPLVSTTPHSRAASVLTAAPPLAPADAEKIHNNLKRDEEKRKRFGVFCAGGGKATQQFLPSSSSLGPPGSSTRFRGSFRRLAA